MAFILPRIYPITDTTIPGLAHREQVEGFAAAGAGLIQLRDKTATPRDFYEAAVAAIAAGHALGVKVIINDRVDIALCSRADGVHLGQDDMPPDAARKVLGPDAIIGFSTHSVEQAHFAVNNYPVDYIAIGPIFATTTKSDPDPVVGLDGLQAVRAAIGDFPLVAIGGISVENYGSVFAAGADSVATISNADQLLSDLPTVKHC